MNPTATVTTGNAGMREANVPELSIRRNSSPRKTYIDFAQQAARALGSLLALTATFVSDIHENRSIIARYSGHRWCDSTERELNNELLGRRSWFDSNQF